MKSGQYINDRMKSMGVLDTFGTKKEIKELQKILHDDEELLYITSGLMDGNTWLITATDRRVIFLDKGFIYGLKQKEIPLEKINSIEQSTGLIFGEISIWDGASKSLIKQVNKATVKTMVDTINKAIKEMKQSVFSNKVSSIEPKEDIIQKIKGLSELKE